jgi:hypothetical protein
MATTNAGPMALGPMDSSPYLSPIEKPKGLMLRLLYRILGRQFGKVPSWLSVWSARMPLAHTSWRGKVNKLNKKLTFPADTVALIRRRVDSVNMCTWCLDAGTWHATHNAPHQAITSSTSTTTA